MLLFISKIGRILGGNDMSLINRSEVPEQETWDLGDLFPSEEDYLAAIDALKAEVDAVVVKLTGNITNAQGAVD